MIGKLSRAALNIIVYSILTKGNIILKDENLSEEAECFICAFDALYCEDKNNEEIQYIINILKEEFSGENSIYHKDNYLQSLADNLHELGFKTANNPFFNEVKRIYNQYLNH